MQKKVFISHSELDKDIAISICESLESQNVGCWIAPRDIPYGQDWAGKITDAIKDSCLFVFILSKNSNISRQCPKELNIADNAGIPILCIRIDNIQLSSHFEYHLAVTQIMDIDIDCLNNQLHKIAFAVKDTIETTTRKSLDININQFSKQDLNNSKRTNKYTNSIYPYILFFILPVLYAIIRIFGCPDSLPDYLLRIAEILIKNPYLSLASGILGLVTWFAEKYTLEYQEKFYSESNIGDEFFGNFQLFVNRLIEISNRNITLKQTPEKNNQFASIYNFDGLKVASTTGEFVDYFSVIFTKLKNPFCKFFYIDKYVPKRIATKYLIKQGFNFTEKEKNVLHFSKDDIHLRIGCRRFFPGILGIEFARKDVESNLEKRLENKFPLEFPKSIVDEIKLLDKKDKLYLFISITVSIASAILLIYLYMNFIDPRIEHFIQNEWFKSGEEFLTP